MRGNFDTFSLVGGKQLLIFQTLTKTIFSSRGPKSSSPLPHHSSWSDIPPFSEFSPHGFDRLSVDRVVEQLLVHDTKQLGILLWTKQKLKVLTLKKLTRIFSFHHAENKFCPGKWTKQIFLLPIVHFLVSHAFLSCAPTASSSQQIAINLQCQATLISPFKY